MRPCLVSNSLITIQKIISKTSSFIIKFFILAGFAILLLIFISVIKQTYNKDKVQNEIDSLMIKAKQIDKENIEIKDKIAYLESDNYREKEAKDKLNLQKPGENVVVIKPGVVKETQAGEDQPRISYPEKINIPSRIKWWDYFFKY